MGGARRWLRPLCRRGICPTPLRRPSDGGGRPGLPPTCSSMPLVSMAGGFVLVMSRASQHGVVLLGRLRRYRLAAMLSHKVRGLCPFIVQSRIRVLFKLVAALTAALRAARVRRFGWHTQQGAPLHGGRWRPKVRAACGRFTSTRPSPAHQPLVILSLYQSVKAASHARSAR
jgi:hypothetical protein